MPRASSIRRSPEFGCAPPVMRLLPRARGVTGAVGSARRSTAATSCAVRVGVPAERAAGDGGDRRRGPRAVRAPVTASVVRRMTMSARCDDASRCARSSRSRPGCSPARPAGGRRRSRRRGAGRSRAPSCRSATAARRAAAPAGRSRRAASASQRPAPRRRRGSPCRRRSARARVETARLRPSRASDGVGDLLGEAAEGGPFAADQRDDRERPVAGGLGRPARSGRG